MISNTYKQSITCLYKNKIKGRYNIVEKKAIANEPRWIGRKLLTFKRVGPAPIRFENPPGYPIIGFLSHNKFTIILIIILTIKDNIKRHNNDNITAKTCASKVLIIF